MADEGTPEITDNPIDLPDSTTNEIGQVDAAVATAASFFGYSIRGDFAKVAAIEADANFLQNGPNNSRQFTLGSGGPVKVINGIDEDDEDQKRTDEFRDGMAMLDEERERQREEWEHTESTFADVTMTGAEWSEFSNDLKQDTPLRRWLIDRMKRDGKTTVQAEAMTNTLAELTHIQSIPKDQRTAEQQQMLDLADQNPEYKKYTQLASDQSDQLRGPDSELHRENAAAGQGQSIAARNDIFSNTLDLTAHHREAVAALTPLDQPPQPETPPPAPPPSNSAGLDL